MSPGVDDAVEDLWRRFSPLVADRLSKVDAYVDAVVAGRPDDRPWREAKSAAHALAGALGSYGRHRGSQLAALLDDELASADPDPAELKRLASGLHDAVGQ